ncbi:MAG: sulfurtransferase TusA family protein [Candidatus Omnitrophota bacterium]
MRNKKITESMDLSGVRCPENAAMVLLKLSGMAAGSCLEVILDDGEPVENVGHSLAQDGHGIISKERMENKWRMIVKKC